MAEKRRLGRGLEDISHYFISAPSERDGSHGLVEERCSFPPSLSVVSGHSRLPCAFVTANLAMELGRIGKKVLVLDAARAAPDNPFYASAANHAYLQNIVREK